MSLDRYTLSKDSKRGGWKLVKDAVRRTVARFATKREASKKGVLSRAVHGWGSVRIEKIHGRFAEERTFPRSADPRKSKG